MHLLGNVAVITHHAVMKAVVVILGTHRQIAFSKAARIRETVLQTCVGRQIGTATIRRGVTSCTEITLSTDMLDRRISGNEMFVIGREPIESHRTGIDIMP